jgi:plastocyanin
MLGLARVSFHEINHPIAITDAPLEDQSPAASAAADGRDVRIDNFAFSPTPATIPAGAAVTWTNKDEEPHRLVGTTEPFKSPVLDTNQFFSHAFATRGTYDYFCSLHPRMTGKVIVV